MSDSDESAYPGQRIEIDGYVRTDRSRLRAKADVGALTISVYDASRWANAQILKIGDGDTQLGPSEIVTINGAPVGTVVTITPALANSYSVGTRVYRLADPTTVTASSQVEPAGTVASETVAAVSTGRHRVTKTLVDADAGEVSIEFGGTGAVVAAGTGTIRVRSPQV